MSQGVGSRTEVAVATDATVVASDPAPVGSEDPTETGRPEDEMDEGKGKGWEGRVEGYLDSPEGTSLPSFAIWNMGSQR